ncbi:MAG: DoxX family protein [Chitinophagales bacterium]|nr:DoxX family protein [Chitinophagales bacterium]
MAKKSLNNIDLKDAGLFIFRVGISYFMIKYHGWGKFQTVLYGDEIKFPNPIHIGVVPSFYIAMIAEFFVSIFIILGLFTRVATLILFVNMLVASYVLYQMGNSMESPMLYCLSYLVMLVAGGGKLTLDYFIRNKK